MPIRWSPEAAEDIENIVERIRESNPAAADKVAEVLLTGIDFLANFPHRGRHGTVKGTRELVFPPLPYLAVYRVLGDVVEIVRIYHGAQDR